ncbi:transmembrane protein 44 isoform X5 [Scyliorhinus canicula]|uniref:transmembrane protein 44 isoform X5 n=1 Tax=Scyliorhinus canicula TaxID=7830 RepID=UPI0018F4D313|nr:transmembrane protein 44 isoform X5 [Scyliorhinus canicula]
MRSAADSHPGRPGGTTRGGGAPTDSSPLWNWNYWINCFVQEKVCISFALWLLSLLLWAIAHIVFFYFRCKRRVWREESLSCSIYTFLGNICNMFGALLAKQLSIQVFTAAYMTAVDVLRFVLILFPVCGSRSSSKTDQQRLRNKRRRSAMFMVCLPFAMGTSYYCWASPAAQVDIRGPRRKLLTTLLQDNTEIIGYALGVIAVFVAWTSKFPLILKASSDWMPLNIPQNNRYLRKMAEIGHYMDMSIEPVQEIGFGVKRLPGDGQTCTERGKRVDTLFVHDPPMYPPKQIIHANVSSCSSSDATSINSELEQKYLEALNSEQWDFEDIPQEWKMTRKQQEHTLNHSPDHIPVISMHSFPTSISSSTSTTDFWLSDTETMMTEEATSAILAQYEEEVNRSKR